MSRNVTKSNEMKMPFFKECNQILKNQSVENAGVAFANGADERNKLFEKIISNVGRTSAGEQGKGLTISGMN